MVSGRGQRLGLLAMRLRVLGVKGMAQAGLRQCRFWAARLQPKLQPVTRIPQPESRNSRPEAWFHCKNGSRPWKRRYRTVSGALLLSKR